MIIYQKSIDEDEVVRLETRCRRAFFRDKKLNSMIAAATLPPEITFDKLSFKIFDLYRFLKRLESKYLDSSTTLKDKAIEFQSEFFASYDRVNNGGGLLAVKNYVKNNYGDPNYLFDTYPFEDYFKKLLNGKTFI